MNLTVLAVLEGGTDLIDQARLTIVLAEERIHDLVAAAGQRIVNQLLVARHRIQPVAKLALERMLARTVAIGLFPECVEAGGRCFSVLHTLLPQ